MPVGVTAASSGGAGWGQAGAPSAAECNAEQATAGQLPPRGTARLGSAPPTWPAKGDRSWMCMLPCW